MVHVHEGQCGLCTHFGEHHQPEPELVELRQTHEGPDDLVEECGHPKHAPLNLVVTPTSGCDGFEPVTA